MDVVGVADDVDAVGRGDEGDRRSGILAWMPEPLLEIATLTEPSVSAVTTSALEPSCARFGFSPPILAQTGSMPCGGFCAGSTPIDWAKPNAVLE